MFREELTSTMILSSPKSLAAHPSIHDKVRILVLGDTGVGKTSLMTLISTGKPNLNHSSTVGAAYHVKVPSSAIFKALSLSFFFFW
jgi:GTPase SAR1 family protein